MEPEFRCDRCGETYSLKGIHNLTNIQMVAWDVGVPREYEFNLCPSCVAKLNDWLKGNA